jgi:hypothetical protein
LRHTPRQYHAAMTAPTLSTLQIAARRRRAWAARDPTKMTRAGLRRAMRGEGRGGPLVGAGWDVCMCIEFWLAYKRLRPFCASKLQPTSIWRTDFGTMQQACRRDRRDRGGWALGSRAAGAPRAMPRDGRPDARRTRRPSLQAPSGARVLSTLPQKRMRWLPKSLGFATSRTLSLRLAAFRAMKASSASSSPCCPCPWTPRRSS